MTIICVACKTHYRPERNDVRVFETMENGDIWNIWSADKLKCPGCGDEVVSGFGRKALMRRVGFGGEIEIMAGRIREHVGPGPDDNEIVEWFHHSPRLKEAEEAALKAGNFPPRLFLEYFLRLGRKQEGGDEQEAD